MEKYQFPLRHVAMHLDELGASDGLVPATEQDYKDFCAGVMLYTELLGLTDWAINFRWEWQDNCIAASLFYNNEARSATFVFSREINQFFKNNPTMLMRLALHETLHLLFAEIMYFASAEELGLPQKKALLNNAEHGAVRRLENVLMGLPEIKSGNYFLHVVRDSADKNSK